MEFSGIHFTTALVPYQRARALAALANSGPITKLAVVGASAGVISLAYRYHPQIKQLVNVLASKSGPIRRTPSYKKRRSAPSGYYYSSTRRFIRPYPA